MISGQIIFTQMAVPAENIPLVFRCGFVLLLALVMVLMKDDDKEKKMKKYP